MLLFREFRPIDSQQSSSHLFHPSTEEILLGGGVSACGLWLVLFGLLLGCLCLFLHHLIVFPSFNDDLGTMPTWRPYSWKKNKVGPDPSLGQAMSFPALPTPEATY